MITNKWLLYVFGIVVCIGIIYWGNLYISSIKPTSSTNMIEERAKELKKEYEGIIENKNKEISQLNDKIRHHNSTSVRLEYEIERLKREKYQNIKYPQTLSEIVSDFKSMGYNPIVVNLP